MFLLFVVSVCTTESLIDFVFKSLDYFKFLEEGAGGGAGN